jgi:membrane protein DedA with SNARE-associated domain
MDGLLGSATELSTALVSVFVGFALVLDSMPLLGILIPADVAVLAATTARSPLASIAVVAAVVLGTVAGWTLTFTLGRFLAGPLRRSWLGRKIGEERWANAERLVAKGGGRVVLAAPFLPIFNTIVPIAAGSLRMPYRKFLAYAAVGSALWGAGYVTLGLVANSLGSALFGTSNIFTTLLFGVPGLAIGWVTLAQVRRRMATPDASADPARAGRVVATVTAVATSQPSEAASAARSSVPARRPLPTTSIARPAATRSGTTRPAPKRLTRRSRVRSGAFSPESVLAGGIAELTDLPEIAEVTGAGEFTDGSSQASTIIATAANANPPMLATACAMSWWLALSYGGSGHPVVQGTAPETPANGAATANDRTAIVPASRSASRRHPTWTLRHEAAA